MGLGRTQNWLVPAAYLLSPIESFVSQNVEELSEFASEKVSQNMRLLLATYNERISRVELDLSLQIRIPTAMDK